MVALVVASPLLGQTGALTVDVSKREEVRQFFRAVYGASQNAPMGWTGNYATGAAGDTSAAFKEATRLRINFFRALAGVPAGITFDPTFSAKDQQAALMMSANSTLDHFPPASWTFYTADGAEAAGKSNLALGEAGADAITGYIADAGSNNAALGHRRWLIYPQTQQMGTGDVPGDTTHAAANAVWVLDGRYGTTRPVTRALQVPYPPAGFVPYSLVFPRWSFTYPGADFSAATVTMTRAGQPVAVALEPIAANVGEPTLAWAYGGLDTKDATPHAVPATDTTYTVNVANVRVNGAPLNFTYDVTVFDPDVAGADATPVAVLPPPTITVGVAGTYTVTKPTFASGFEWRTVQLSPFNQTFTAETGLEGLVATTTAGYNPVQSLLVGSGAAAYRLAHPQPQATEVLALPGQFYISNAGAALSWQSRIGVATAVEVAHVQASTDDGLSWSDLYAQAGTSPSNTSTPPPTENAFTTRTASLSGYVGRTIRLRLTFVAESGTIFVANATNTTGWFIDNITLAGVQVATGSAATRVDAGNTFALTPAADGAFALQARGVMFGAYPLEWGPVVQATAATGADGPTARLSNLSVRTTMAANQVLIVGATVAGGPRDILVRADGPALAAFGLGGTMEDPRLDIYRDQTFVLTNDDWQPALKTVFPTVGAFAFADGSTDAAVVQTMSGSYSIQTRGTGPGLVLVEAYDLGSGNAARLTNISARNVVGTGDNILIAGFSISGTGTKRLLIRGVGPKLQAFGVANVLNNPKLEVYRDGNVFVTGNDDWDATLAPTFTAAGAFGLDNASKDAALVATLNPGTYTVQVKGADGGTGEALVEIYELP